MVKEGITATIEELRKLQVNLKIITGDNINVAKAIGFKIGIADPKVITGQELLNSSSEALRKLAKQTHIFADVEPQQKGRILQALRKSYTVAYMGDGQKKVNSRLAGLLNQRFLNCLFFLLSEPIKTSSKVNPPDIFYFSVFLG